MSDALTSSGPRPRPGLASIRPYKPGDATLEGFPEPIKLSSNENCLGASPRAIAAYQEAAAHLELYPEAGAMRDLTEAIAQRYDLDPDRIVCGAGSDELLQILARAYAGPGDEILYSQHGFLIYRLAALQTGATPVTAPETDLTTDVDALLAGVTDKTRIVYVANPNNPTGTLISEAEVARLHAGLPAHVLLVVDGAYAEFIRDGDYDGGLALAARAPNVVATRTFSKIHGLAALRLGWAYGPEPVMSILNRVRGPFNVSAPAYAAGVAAINDVAFATASADHAQREREYLAGAFAQLGVLAAQPTANFVLARFPATPGRTAADADAALRARGVLVRGVGAYGLEDCLRVTVGRRDDNVLVVDTLTDLLAS